MFSLAKIREIFEMGKPLSRFSSFRGRRRRMGVREMWEERRGADNEKSRQSQIPSQWQWIASENATSFKGLRN